MPAEAICWHRFFGALQLALICLLFLSGALMAFAYTPVPGTAYDSVDYFQFSLPLGNVVRGVHHYAWNLLLVVMGLHLLRALILGAYKAPRQIVWISGVSFFLLMPLLIITGDLLPWDQKGYWSTQVRFSIIASIPVAGDFLVQLFRGGPLTGIVALTRLYVLHILLLPVRPRSADRLAPVFPGDPGLVGSPVGQFDPKAESPFHAGHCQPLAGSFHRVGDRIGACCLAMAGRSG